ncbi:SDR family oxidoreductase [Streptomyces sp. NPDC059916]|uniref:SDR family oxidoreductase n=1 Tax=Streptomyces sp. NPDC059916 TaxID=3347001 RepID=UPI0036A73E0E
MARRRDAADARAVAALAAQIAPIQRLIITLTGNGGAGPFRELPIDGLRQAFEEKYWPTVTALQAGLAHLSKDASVTLVGAVTARAAMPGTAGIGSLNAAVEGLVQPLAAELAPIRIDAVSPGYVDTPWWDGLAAEEREGVFASAAASLPTKRIATAPTSPRPSCCWPPTPTSPAPSSKQTAAPTSPPDAPFTAAGTLANRPRPTLEVPQPSTATCTQVLAAGPGGHAALLPAYRRRTRRDPGRRRTVRPSTCHGRAVERTVHRGPVPPGPAPPFNTPGRPRSSWGGIRRGIEAWEALMPQSARPPRQVGAAGPAL